MSKAIKVVTVKLEKNIREKLKNLSQVKSRSTHWLMKKAIDDYVAKEELKEKLRQESINRWKEAEAGQVVAHDEVLEWLDSWGSSNEKRRP